MVEELYKVITYLSHKINEVIEIRAKERDKTKYAYYGGAIDDLIDAKIYTQKILKGEK